MGKGLWTVSLEINAHPQLPLPPPFGLTSQHFLSMFAIAVRMEGEFGGNPFSSSDWLWFFFKRTANLLLWSLGFFFFPFMNQHRVGL